MSGYVIRRATVADAPVLARHRAEMFRDMGQVTDALYDTLAEASRAYFVRAIPEGRYVAWVATEETGAGQVIGGAGLELRALLPRPAPQGARLLRGPQAQILNVFTERSWRRRGVALALMRELMRWCTDQGIESLVLHASDDGRALYERLGFTPTNEMRFTGES